MSELRTDFKDDVLDVTQNEKRKYRVIHNEDGTISLEDATVYLQQGDSFGANDLNEMNRMANQMNEAAGEILTMADDIDTLQDEMADISPKVETLENRPTTLLCTDSEVRSEEFECDIPMFSLASGENVMDMLCHDGKIYCLVSKNSDYSLHLYIYDGGSWTTKHIHSGKNNAVSSSSKLQELNGEIYFSYSYLYEFSKLCRYKNGSIETIKTVSTTLTNQFMNCCLAKDYDENMLYWVRSTYHNATNPQSLKSNYQSFDGTTLGAEITWYYATKMQVQGAYVKNGKLYISCYTTSYFTREVDLSNGQTKSFLPPQEFRKSLKINDEFIDMYSATLFHNSTPIHPAIQYDIFEDGLLVIEYRMTASTSGNSGVYLFKKIKLYRKLQTYAKTNDIIQVGDSFAISDNLETIDNGYRVTTEGKAEIGLYL